MNNNRQFSINYKLEPLPAPRPRVGRGRGYNNNEYTQYLSDLITLTQMEMRRLKFQPLEGEYLYAYIEFMGPRVNKCDVDNLCKTVLDGVTKSGLIKDDRYIYKLSSIKVLSKKEKNIHLVIKEIQKEMEPYK